MILRAPLNGDGGAVGAISSNQDEPSALAITPQAVFWINGDVSQTSNDGLLMTAPLDGGATQALTPFLNLGGRAVATDGVNVYWTQTGSILSRPVEGGATSTLVTNVSPNDIAIDTTNLYWTDRNANAILRMSLGGGAVTTVATSFSLPWHLALDATNVYWTDFSNLVLKAPK